MDLTLLRSLLAVADAGTITVELAATVDATGPRLLARLAVSVTE